MLRREKMHEYEQLKTAIPLILPRKNQRNSEDRKLLPYGMTTGQTVDVFSVVR